MNPYSLSDLDLLTSLTGLKVEEAQILYTNAGGFQGLGRMSYDELRHQGVSPSKATKIVATMEVCRRKVNETFDVENPIKSSKDGYWIMASHLMDLNVEEFWVVVTNRANVVTKKIKISEGGMHGTVVDVKVLMKKVLLAGASGIMIYHNHPSGNLYPSNEDRLLTKKIKSACELLDIRLLDHMIIAGNKYTSFTDEGWL